MTTMWTTISMKETVSPMLIPTIVYKLRNQQIQENASQMLGLYQD